MKDIEGLGITKQRQAVLRVIRDSEEHLTANEVFDKARRIQPGISFATVYNSLRFLKEQGMIGEVRFGNDASRYDRTLERHDHAICNACEKLIDLDLPVPDELLRKGERLSKFKAESIEVVLRGLCPDCR
jgi:Fur family ferric uptake transcriptional regulator/Fur family peroxide stress response transcriptional regulator